MKITKRPVMAWTILVCRTCGRVAQWPFCEHRDQDRQPWCVAVTVRPVASSERRLRKLMQDKQAKPVKKVKKEGS